MRWHAALAGVSACLFLLSVVSFRQTLPPRDHGTLSSDFRTPYIHTRPEIDTPTGTVLILHGLDSNKEFMQLLAMALSDAGFETWTIDLPGHGDSPARFDSATSLQATGEALDMLPPGTVLIGHSLGAGLLADLAMSRPIGTAVLLSPPPIPLARLRVQRLLVISGGFDAPGIDAAIPALMEHAGSGAEWMRFPWAAHSSVLYNPVQQRALIEWIGESTSRVRTPERLLWITLMAISLTGIALAAWLRLRHLPASPVEAGLFLDVPAPTDAIARVGALGASIAILAFVSPLSWLSLFRTDYLIGVFLISGLILWRGRGFGISASGLVISLGAAGILLLALWLAGSMVMHIVPSGGQWLRFPVITAACLPLCLYDERVLRAYPPLKMWGMFLLSRVLIWAAVMTGVLIFSPRFAFLVLVTHLIMIGWVPVWWLAGLVGGASREPAAGAVFAAVFLGWVFAALFVTI